MYTLRETVPWIRSLWNATAHTSMVRLCTLAEIVPLLKGPQDSLLSLQRSFLAPSRSRPDLSRSCFGKATNRRGFNVRLQHDWGSKSAKRSSKRKQSLRRRPPRRPHARRPHPFPRCVPLPRPCARLPRRQLLQQQQLRPASRTSFLSTPPHSQRGS